MIKEILAVFRKDTLMERAFQRSYEMLHLTQQMFLEAKNVLRETDTNNLEIDIDDQDSEVNKYQRDVRKDVFSHLVISGNEQLSSGLALITIIIDIERIGDFTKIIAAIAKKYKAKLTAGIFEERLMKLEQAIDDSFSRTIKIFEESNEEAGRELIKEYKWISIESDALIDSLIQEEDPTINAGCAAALTLYIRSIKRVHSHLRNVVTSVVNPFHRIGYKPKKQKG